MSLMFFLISVLLSCASTSVLSTGGTNDDECALLRIKEQLGNPWMVNQWAKGFDFCNHYPIQCSGTGRVIALNLQGISDATTFPDAICELTELQYLIIFDSPGFYGTVPSCITRLANLRQLQLSDTSFSGPLPSFQNHLSITWIYVYNNKFSGTVPASLATCPKLMYLDASSNYLTGTIPTGLAIANLILSNNNLTGEIPTFYGSINFTKFDVANNQLTGDASFLFGKQKATYIIILAHNNFNFDLNTVDFSNNIVMFDISHNNIYGEMPQSIVEATRLQYADLSYNKLCGEIPQGGSYALSIPEIYANNLCLCGFPLPPCSGSGPALPPAAPAPAPAPSSD